MQTCIFFKGYLLTVSSDRQIQARGRRPSLAGPSGAQRSKERDSVRTRFGGAERDRTADPLLAKQVLSQLSYSPNHRTPDSQAVRDQ